MRLWSESRKRNIVTKQIEKQEKKVEVECGMRKLIEQVEESDNRVRKWRRGGLRMQLRKQNKRSGERKYSYQVGRQSRVRKWSENVEQEIGWESRESKIERWREKTE